MTAVSLYITKKLSLTVKASFFFWRLWLTSHRRISAAASVVSVVNKTGSRRLWRLRVEGAPFSPGDSTLIFQPKFWNITLFIIVRILNSTTDTILTKARPISGLSCPELCATDDGRVEICTGLQPTQFQTYLIEITEYFMLKYIDFKIHVYYLPYSMFNSNLTRKYCSTDQLNFKLKWK